MGKTAATIGRVAAAVGTGGTSELVRTAGVTAGNNIGGDVGAITESVINTGSPTGAVIGTATGDKAGVIPKLNGAGGDGPEGKAVPDLPTPDLTAVAAAQDEAERKARLASASRTNTVATSPQGVLGLSTVNRPSLIALAQKAALGA